MSSSLRYRVTFLPLNNNREVTADSCIHVAAFGPNGRLSHFVPQRRRALEEALAAMNGEKVAEVQRHRAAIQHLLVWRGDSPARTAFIWKVLMTPADQLPPPTERRPTAKTGRPAAQAKANPSGEVLEILSRLQRASGEALRREPDTRRRAS